MHTFGTKLWQTESNRVACRHLISQSRRQTAATSDARKPHDFKQKSLIRRVCEQGFSSGDDGDRTRNLRLAKPALSQLSYVPRGRNLDSPSGLQNQKAAEGSGGLRVGVLGFEPRTSALSELRSSQLSYTPQRLRHEQSSTITCRRPARSGDSIAADGRTVQSASVSIWNSQLPAAKTPVMASSVSPDSLAKLQSFCGLPHLANALGQDPLELSESRGSAIAVLW